MVVVKGNEVIFWGMGRQKEKKWGKFSLFVGVSLLAFHSHDFQ